MMPYKESPDGHCPFQLCFRLLSHPVLCGQAERCKAHVSYLQDGAWCVQTLINYY